jgi:hypothetical protein
MEVINASMLFVIKGETVPNEKNILTTNSQGRHYNTDEPSGTLGFVI